MRLVTTALLVSIGGSAWAGPALTDDNKTPARTTEPTAAPDTTAVAEDKVDYGIDLRIRSVHVPQALLELFTEKAPGGASNVGFGVDFVRRRGNLELQLGFEYEHINVDEGVFIEKGKTVPGDAADYILGPNSAPENFGWFTLEFTFLNHAPINKYVSFRYGGGAGLGIMTGGVYRWDVACAAGATNANPEPGCVPGDKISSGTGHTSDDSNGAPESTPVKYGIPPVFPVVNAIIGLQIKPFDRAVINLEAGIRTLPFFGMSLGYFFP
jgi:hypothetical protein